MSTKSVKLKIEVILTSEDDRKLERTLMDMITKTTTLVKKKVNKKSNSIWENSIKVDYKYNIDVERC